MHVKRDLKETKLIFLLDSLNEELHGNSAVKLHGSRYNIVLSPGIYFMIDWYYKKFHILTYCFILSF